MYKIVENRQLNSSVFLMKIEAPLISRKIKPGQFIILRVDEFGERIPLTVADFDGNEGTLTIIAQAIGKTTKKMSEIKVGEFISDVVGPLGKETEFGDAKKICVIGGGVGCAIAYPSAKYLFKDGCDVDIIAGFRNRDLIILEKEMGEISQNFILVTDDGSNGKQGFVTMALEEQLQSKEYDLVIAIGPVRMMEAVCKITKERKIKTIVSLNPLMIDGTGMCGGCRVSVGNQVQFACVDGPDFDGHLVDFENLIERNNKYQEVEKHQCNLMKEEK
ncbi:MAG: sulfide/dihydroorotate dehydrogenase-like FAD/NAD-binding protein [Anaerorhabdus sp.]